MLLDCITGKAQSEIVLLKPDGLAFDNYKIGEFFQELLKKFTHKKDKEVWKMECLARRQARNEDARQYYTDKLRLFVQAYPPARRSLVEFKNNMLLGLYNAEIRKTCLTFMRKEIKHEPEDLDPRAPAQDMAGFQSTYRYDESKITKANEMLKTGQVPMDVNAMPGLVEYVSDAEDLDFEGGRRKTPARNSCSANSQPSILCYNCGKQGHISRECRGEQRNQGRRGNGGQMVEMAKSMEAMQEVLKKLVPEAVFP